LRQQCTRNDMTVLEELMESFDDYQRESQEESITIEKLKEVIKNKFLKKEKRQLKDFCNHLNTYKGFKSVRFDFMLIDFLATNKPNKDVVNICKNCGDIMDEDDFAETKLCSGCFTMNA